MSNNETDSKFTLFSIKPVEDLSVLGDPRQIPSELWLSQGSEDFSLLKRFDIVSQYGMYYSCGVVAPHYPIPDAEQLEDKMAAYQKPLNELIDSVLENGTSEERQNIDKLLATKRINSPELDENGIKPGSIGFTEVVNGGKSRNVTIYFYPSVETARAALAELEGRDPTTYFPASLLSRTMPHPTPQPVS
jgi:hypothetical protein